MKACSGLASPLTLGAEFPLLLMDSAVRASPFPLLSLLVIGAAAPAPLAALSAGLVPQEPPVRLQAGHPATPLERSDFRDFTPHDALVDYLAEVRAISPDMGLEFFGTTHLGRGIPMAVLSRPRVTSPADAHRSGKPIVVLGANAHGYNYLLRESLLLLTRELATPGTELNALLDRVVVLVVPSKNPDGAEAGTRPNAAGADLNRDYMTLDQPESAAYVRSVLNRWEPHLYVDGHDGGAAQYGGAYPYSLLFQGAGLAGADPSLTAIADQEIFPRLQRDFQGAGLEAFYWARGDGERWYGGGAAPRMGRNYGGLSDRIPILFELAEWHATREAVEIGVLAFRSVLEYARDHGEALISTVEEARRRTVELGERGEGRIPVRETLEAEEFRVTYRIRDPGGGDSLVTVADAELRKRPVGTVFRDRPWAYLLPPQATEAVALLRRHGIQVERLVRSTALPVRSYTLAAVRHLEGDNGNRSALQVEVGEERDGEMEVGAGSFLVRTGQPLGRVVAHLLEPETGDGIVHWNRITHLLPLAEFQTHREDPASHPPPLLPIHKVMRRGEVPAVAIP